MIQPERITVLHQTAPARGKYVLYWMQASQRTEDNHALEYAVDQASAHGKPLVVFFGITDSFPEANLRHYQFMLEGLAEVSQSLARRGICFVCQKVSPETGALALSKDAVITVTDCGYLSIQKKWRTALAERITCPLIQVETDVIVPVTAASPKEAYSAGTLRPKINAQLPRYLVPLKKRKLLKNSLSLRIPSLDLENRAQILKSLRIDRSITPSGWFCGGPSRAKHRLNRFLKTACTDYHEKSSDPAADGLSHLSPYLHFGQISPLTIALAARKISGPGSGAYLEELIVRRELSMNFVHYNPCYDGYAALPAWARKTLDAHAEDLRPYIYSLTELEQSRTHDPYWNAAQQEMILTGKMHGYMRMYWGKKVIEWTQTPQEAYSRLLYLNNRYFLDGRDPNGFAGVAWCFGKHDRAWAERPIFGKVRYMNARGLERKFDIKAYVEKVRQL